MALQQEKLYTITVKQHLNSFSLPAPFSLTRIP